MREPPVLVATIPRSTVGAEIDREHQAVRHQRVVEHRQRRAGGHDRGAIDGVDLDGAAQSFQ